MSLLVRDQHSGGSRVDPAPQEREHRLAGLAVEGAGRLVGENQPSISHEGSSDSDALLLPARHLVGIAVGEVSDTDVVECGQREVTRTASAVELEGERDVLGRGERGDEVEVLEHIADRATSDRREVCERQGGEVDAFHEDAAGGDRVEAARDVEQRRFARSARPHHGDEFARRYGEADPSQGMHRGRTSTMDAGDVDELEHGSV